MLRVSVLAFAFVALSLPAAAAGDTCLQPMPSTLKIDGATATVDQIKAASDEFTVYQNQSNEYLQCLTKYEASLGKKITSEQKSSITAKYNAAVDDQKATADALNKQIEAYCKGHPCE